MKLIKLKYKVKNRSLSIINNIYITLKYKSFKYYKNNIYLSNDSKKNHNVNIKI
jgi:hypothetical protein